jgi:hypothetical protein
MNAQQSVEAIARFEATIADAPAEAQVNLRRAVAWARELVALGLVEAYARARPKTPTLNLRVPRDKRAPVTIWNDGRTPQLALAGTVIAELAPRHLKGAGVLVAPKRLASSTAAYSFDDPTFEFLTSLYREASTSLRSAARGERRTTESRARKAAMTMDILFADSYEPGVKGRDLRRDPFMVDPNEMDRATRVHQETQDALWRTASEQGLTPLPARSAAIDFDLGWQISEKEIAIVEVKSISAANEAKQVRLGIGQLLDYAQSASVRFQVSVTMVLALSRAPTDVERWESLCRSVGISVVWPETWTEALWPAGL